MVTLTFKRTTKNFKNIYKICQSFSKTLFCKNKNKTIAVMTWSTRACFWSSEGSDTRREPSGWAFDVGIRFDSGWIEQSQRASFPSFEHYSHVSWHTSSYGCHEPEADQKRVSLWYQDDGIGGGESVALSSW